jgi:hypothetical protein
MSETKVYSISKKQGKMILRKIAWWKIRRAVKRLVYSWPFVSALLIIFLAGGILIGVKIMEPIHDRAIAAVRAERDAARADAMVWFGTVRSIVEGEQPEAIGIPGLSEGD